MTDARYPREPNADKRLAGAPPEDGSELSDLDGDLDALGELDPPEARVAAGDLEGLELDPDDPLVRAEPELVEAFASLEVDDLTSAIDADTAAEDREELLIAHARMADLLQEASDELEDYEDDDESDEADDLREREQAMYAAEWSLRTAYRDSIPLVPISRCPITGEEVRHSLDVYGLDGLSGSQRRRSTITTKLMVDRRFRGTKLPMQLARAAYAHTLETGMLYDFIDCNDHLVGFFEKLGYRSHRGKIHHPDYGDVNSMYIALQDAVHLYNVGSPIYSMLLAHQENHRVYA